MTKTSVACIILAAGKGTRMRSALPKVLHEVARKPMVQHVLDAAGELAPQSLHLVVGPEMEAVQRTVEGSYKNCHFAIQTEQLGTAHAVLAARSSLEGFDGHVIILYGDTPLIRPETLESMVETLESNRDTAVVVLGMRPDDPAQYGRLLTDRKGRLEKIVEYKDATTQEREITLCNSGVMAIRGGLLFGFLDKVGNANAKGEYYLTDIVAIARAGKYECQVVEADAGELAGVNSRLDLAAAEQVLQQRLRMQAMENGVTLVAPETVYLSADTVLGKDVIVHPHVVFGPGVTIEDNVTIKPFCHIEGAVLSSGVTMGPYARLRPGAHLGEGVHIGNFVEIKKSTLEAGAKVNHLSYIGDADVGEGANIGAGTITCNYDGFEKHRTTIGARSFIGSNTSLVAPITVGDGAIVGAGSVITEDVEEKSLALSRPDQKHLLDWAEKFRERKSTK